MVSFTDFKNKMNNKKKPKFPPLPIFLSAISA